jgi:hypothetical protein
MNRIMSYEFNPQVSDTQSEEVPQSEQPVIIENRATAEDYISVDGYI